MKKKCCHDPQIINGNCLHCPGQYSPEKWEVVIPSMENYPMPPPSPAYMHPPFQECPHLCASNKVSGSKLLVRDHSLDCMWRYEELWDPVCEGFPLDLLPVITFGFSIATRWWPETGRDELVAGLSIQTCTDPVPPRVCVPPSAVLAVYYSVIDAKIMQSCREVELMLCDNDLCNFFINEKSCAWPEALVVEAR